MLKSFKPEEILEMRKRFGLTQQELADKLKVSQQLVSYWETGQRELKEEHQALLAEYILDERKKERKTTAKPKQTIPDIPVERKLSKLLDVISLYPNPTLHAQAANLFLQIGKPDEALDHINETLKARPDSPPFMMIQARCFLMKGEFKKAVPILEQLYFLRPYDSNIIARLAQAYHGAGETAQAKELLVSAINIDLERGYKNRFLASILCDLK
jgi:predicted Zn-dependent protease